MSGLDETGPAEARAIARALRAVPGGPHFSAFSFRVLTLRR